MSASATWKAWERGKEGVHVRVAMPLDETLCWEERAYVSLRVFTWDPLRWSDRAW